MLGSAEQQQSRPFFAGVLVSNQPCEKFSAINFTVLK